MDRRTLLASLALVPAIPALATCGRGLRAESQDTNELVPPDGDINVAALLSDGAVVIDFCGPWEVFNNVAVGGPHTSHDHRMPFKTYTVAESREPIRASGGMRIMPDYTLDDAPVAHIVVIPAQRGRSDRMLDWIRTSHETTDLTMSVCTGSSLLASTGLLDSRAATTHHRSSLSVSIQLLNVFDVDHFTRSEVDVLGDVIAASPGRPRRLQAVLRYRW